MNNIANYFRTFSEATFDYEKYPPVVHPPLPPAQSKDRLDLLNTPTWMTELSIFNQIKSILTISYNKLSWPEMRLTEGNSKVSRLIYYEVSPYVQSMGEHLVDGRDYFTAATVARIPAYQLPNFHFDLIFKSRSNNLENWVWEGLEKDYFPFGNSMDNRILNVTLGAHWTYQYLMEQGFTMEPTENGYHFTKSPTTLETESPINLQEINQTVEAQLALVTKRFSLTKEQLAEKGAYGKGIDPPTLLELITGPESQSNLQSIRANLIGYMRWKVLQYQQKYTNFNKQIAKQAEIYRTAELTKEEIKELSSAASNKLIAAHILTAIKLTEEHIKKLGTLTEEDLRADFVSAISDQKNGMTTIIDRSVAKQVATLVSTLVNGYQGFSSSFLNIVITGPAGIGKTSLAYKLSHILTKCHLISTDIVTIASRSDVVASYLGQTAIKIRNLLFENLEGILFIDEAYQVGGCPTPDQYGMEGLTEMVNFLDKYVGISIVMVAGYAKQMKECFFDRNEGLRRRFPIRFELKELTSIQLLRIFLINILESLGDNPFQPEDLYLAYSSINKMRVENYFPNMGGDIIILVNKFVISYLSLGKTREALIESFYEYCTRDFEAKKCTLLVDGLIREKI